MLNAQGYAAGDADTAWPQGISTHTLDNGLAVVLQENHEQQLVAFEIIVKTGSIFEQERQGSGIAHLVEHLLFKGTASRPVGAIEQEVRALGGTINGFTGHEFTGYTLVLPAQNFERGAALLADMLKNPVFDEQEIAKEKEVICSEIRMNHDDPDRYINDAFFRLAYGIAPYNLPVIGFEPLLRQLQRADVVNFHQRWYCPNNMVMAIAGDINTETALESLRQIFKDFPMRPFPQTALPPVVKAIGAENFEENYPVQNARLIIGFPGVALTDADAPVLDIIASILGDGESSRLHTLLVKNKKLVYSVDASNYTPGFRGLFYISALLEKENKTSLLDAINAELQRLKKTPVARKELEKAQNMYTAEYVFSQETVESQAGVLASDYVYSSNPVFSRAYCAAIQRVTPQDIQRCAQKYFLKDSIVTVMAAAAGNAAEKPVPAPAASPITTLRLKNDLRVVLKRNPTQPLVSIQVCIGGGTRWENESDNGKFRLLSAMLLSGTKKRSAPEIAEFFASRGAVISAFSGYNSFGISAQCLKKDFPAVVETLSDIVLNPVFPAPEFMLEKKLAQKNIQLSQDDIFQDTLRVLKNNLFSSYPFRLDPLGTESSVGTISREQLAATYKRFLTASNIVLAVCGDIDEAQARALLEEYFSAMPMETMPTAPVFREPSREEQNLIFRQSDKQQAVVMFGFSGCDVRSNDRPALELINAVLSSPGSKLYEQIRERKGLAYTLGGSSLSGLDGGYFIIYAATAPQDAAQVRAIIEEEIAAIISSPVEEKIIASAKEYIIGQHRIGLQSNSALGFTAALDELYGLGADHYQRFDLEINALNAGALREAAARYLQKQKSVVVITNGK